MSWSFALRDRERLFRRPIFLLLIAIPVLGMIVVYPGRDLAHTLITSDHSDPATLEYAKSAVATDPTRLELRASLAREYANLGDLEQADLTLEPLLEVRGHIGSRARLLSLEIARRRLSAVPAEYRDPARVDDLAARIAAVNSEPLPVADRERLAKLALAHERPQLAGQIYERLARDDPGQQTEWLELAARWYRGGLDGESAARVYSELAYRTTDEAAFTTHALQALESLRAADRAKNALRYLDGFLVLFPRNEAILLEGIELALATEDPSQARSYGRRLVALSPNDDDRLSRQLDLELAVRDFDAAWEVAELLLARRPEDPHIRRQVAQVGLWSGHPDVALEQLEWLAGRGSEDAIERGIDLARQLPNDEALAELLLMKDAGVGLESAEVLELAQVYERLGRSDDTVARLTSHLSDSPTSLDAWVLLAGVHAARGELKEALEVHQEILRRFEISSQDALNTARLMVRLGDDRGAFELLRAHRSKAPPEDDDYWRSLARLAWEEEDDEEALVAYRKLWERGERTEIHAHRIMELSLAVESPSETMPIAEEAWRRFEIPEFLFAAMDAAARVPSMDKLEEYLNIAATHEGGDAFRPHARYWVHWAQLSTFRGREDEANQAYREALRTEPDSWAIRTDYLWFCLDYARRDDLESVIDAWQAEASPIESAWTAFGAATRRLDRPHEAARWYDLHARAHPEDAGWLFGYAELLDEIGRHNAADRVRRFNYGFNRTRVWDDLVAVADAPLTEEGVPSPATTRATELAIAFAHFATEFEGAEEGEAWFQRITDHPSPAPLVRDFAVGWHLARGDVDLARTSLEIATTPEAEPPLWQPLAIAVNDGDHATIAEWVEPPTPRLDLESRNDGAFDRAEELPQPQGIGAAQEVDLLTRLERDEDALVRTTEALDAIRGEADPTQRTLLSYAMRLAPPRGVRLATDLNEQGALAEQFTHLGAVYRLDSWQWEVKAGVRRWSSVNRVFELDRTDESALDTTLTRRGRRGDDTLGVALRTDADAGGWALHYRHQRRHARNIESDWRVAWNERADESDALRVAGVRDRARVGITVPFGAREFVSAAFALSRHRSLEGEAIGSGMQLELQAVHRLHLGHQELSGRVFGVLSRNSVERDVPSDLAILFPNGVESEAILAEENSTWGIGFTWRRGQPGAWNADDRPLRWRVDTWLGWQTPVAEWGFRVEAGVGVRVFGHDELHIGTYYGDIPGGIDDQSSQGLRVDYVVRFGS